MARTSAEEKARGKASGSSQPSRFRPRVSHETPTQSQSQRISVPLPPRPPMAPSSKRAASSQTGESPKRFKMTAKKDPRIPTSPSQSDTSIHDGAESVPESQRVQRATSTVQPTQSGSQMPTQSGASRRSSMPRRRRTRASTKGKEPMNLDAFEPDESYINAPLEIMVEAKYQELAVRNFCPVVWIDLDIFRAETGLDLSPYLNHYAKWLKIRHHYSGHVVRVFFSNMSYESTLRSDNVTIADTLKTTVRGKEIVITPEVINTILGTTPEAPVLPVQRTDLEIDQILRPGASRGPLTFTPKQMPDLHRIIHYIYSRSMINKGNNFTHLNTYDYRTLAAIIAGDPVDVGQLIFDEMRRFFQAKSSQTYIPYPQIISRILDHFGIWFLAEDEVFEIPRFGKAQLNRMHIEAPIIPPRRRAGEGTSREHQDDAQSSAPTAFPEASTPPQPSFLGTSIQVQVQEALKGFKDDLIQTMKKEMVQIVREEFAGVMNDLNDSIITLRESYRDSEQYMRTLDTRLSRRLDSLEKILDDKFPTPSSVPGPSDPISAPTAHPESGIQHIEPEASALAQTDLLSEPALPEPTLNPLQSTSSDSTTSVTLPVLPILQVTTSDTVLHEHISEPSLPHDPSFDVDKKGEKEP